MLLNYRFDFLYPKDAHNFATSIFDAVDLYCSKNTLFAMHTLFALLSKIDCWADVCVVDANVADDTV